jgi:hypothetical protein
LVCWLTRAASFICFQKLKKSIYGISCVFFFKNPFMEVRTCFQKKNPFMAAGIFFPANLLQAGI